MMRKGDISGASSWCTAARLQAITLIVVSAFAFADPASADLQVSGDAWRLISVVITAELLTAIS